MFTKSQLSQLAKQLAPPPAPASSESPRWTMEIGGRLVTGTPREILNAILDNEARLNARQAAAAQAGA